MIPMANIQHHRPIAVWRNLHLWYITAIMLGCSIFYYLDAIIELMGWAKPGWDILYTVHDVHRLLFLIPVLYAAYIFRLRGVIVTVAISMLIFLHHAIFISPYPDALSRPIVSVIIFGIIGILVSRLLDNITERRRVEETLSEREEFTSSLLENAPNPITVINPDTSIRYVNPALEKLTGFSSAELIGREAPYPWWLEEKQQQYSREFEDVMLRGEYRCERLFQRKNGEQFWVEITSIPVERDGELRHFLSIWLDITERKQAEEALRESEEKFRSLFANMLNAFAYCKILVDEDNKPIDYIHLEVNDTWERLVGLKREDVVGKKITEVMPGIKEPETDLISIYGKVALTGEATEFTLFLEPLGKWFAVSVYSPQHGYFVTVFDDITERKQAEEREKQLQQELYLSSRLASIGELAAGVAHEISNPLTGIMGFSQLLLRKSTDEEASRNLKIIHDEAQRVANVVRNLLTFARRREPKKEYSDIHDILQKALELRAYELKAGNVEVVTDFATTLPKVMADFQQIEDVFLNIILNAEQAMTEADGGGKLSIKTGHKKGYVTISFTNDGPGIPAEQLGKLFDPFFTTKGERGGTGLGLSICHGIVTEHGGKIYAKSKQGEGATFFVELPVATEEIDKS